MDYSALNPGNTPIIVVSWQDIVFNDVWGEDDDTVQPIESATVGYLLEDSPTVIVIASSYDFRAERWGSVHAFPKSPPEIVMIKDQVNEIKR